MRQGWIQIASLLADISGFLLIVTGWWNAVIRERALELFHAARRHEQIAAELSATTPRGTFGARIVNYLLLRLVEEKHRAIGRAERLAAMAPILLFRKRLRNFVAGATVVVVGFVLQVLSAIPGGWLSFGIYP